MKAPVAVEGNTRKRAPAHRRGDPLDAWLDATIEEAIVDACSESEQVAGFHTMLESSLATPFNTEVLGVEVTVERIDMTDDDEIVAVCSRGRSRQRIPILGLPLPSPPPEGADSIAAFGRSAGRGG